MKSKQILYALLVVIWTAVILYLLLKTNDIPKDGYYFFKGEDKIVHFTMFFVWSALMTNLILTIERFRLKLFYIIIFILGTLIGMGTEWAQNYIPNRTADVADFLTDVVGTAVGLGVVLLIKKMSKITS